MEWNTDDADDTDSRGFMSIIHRPSSIHPTGATKVVFRVSTIFPSDITPIFTSVLYVFTPPCGMERKKIIWVVADAFNLVARLTILMDTPPSNTTRAKGISLFVLFISSRLYRLLTVPSSSTW